MRLESVVAQMKRETEKRQKRGYSLCSVIHRGTYIFWRLYPSLFVEVLVGKVLV